MDYFDKQLQNTKSYQLSNLRFFRSEGHLLNLDDNRRKISEIIACSNLLMSEAGGQTGFLINNEIKNQRINLKIKMVPLHSMEPS